MHGAHAARTGRGQRDWSSFSFLKKINPQRASTVVEQLALIRKHLALIEREVQKVAAQGDLLAA